MAFSRGKGKGKNDKDKKRGSKNLFRRKKFCRFTVEKVKQIDYKAVSYTHLTLPTNREV